MAKAKKIIEEKVEEVNVPATPNEPKAGKDAVVVSWRGNTRTYSLELHGADFKKLAQEFATKFNGTIE